MATRGQKLIDLIQANFELRGEDVYRKHGPRKGRVTGSIHHKGYRRIVCVWEGRTYRLGYHRVKFCLLHGYLPTIVDHVDGVETNNSGSNLRAATHSENTQNSVRTPRTLPRGVYLRAGRYEAKVGTGPTRKYFGRFDSAEQAEEAVQAYLREAHGQFYKTQPRKKT